MSELSPAEKIAELRRCTGMTQAEFAKAYDIPKRTLENWEEGKRTPPPYVISLLRAAIECAEC